MDDNLNQDQNLAKVEAPKPKKPFWLIFLCIFSFVYLGDEFLTNFLGFLFHGVLKDFLESGMLEDMMEQYSFYGDEVTTAFEDLIIQIVSIDRISYLLESIFCVGAFIGALNMLKLRKNGFHLYAISQILILTVEVLYVTKVTSVIPWFDIILTAAFIGIFFMYYRKIME